MHVSQPSSADPSPGTSSLVLVAGATGGTGRALLPVLAAQGVPVRALARSAAAASSLRELGAVDVVIGDLLHEGTAERAVQDTCAVLCAVGPGTSPRTLFFGPLVDDAGTSRLIDAAARAHVKRFVYQSTIGVGSSAPGMGRIDRLVLRRTLAAKQRAETRLRSGDMPYVVLRPGRLHDRPPTHDIVLAEGGGRVSGSISRSDVARVMVAALLTEHASGLTVEVVDRTGVRGSPVPAAMPWDWPATAAAVQAGQ